MGKKKLHTVAMGMIQRRGIITRSSLKYGTIQASTFAFRKNGTKFVDAFLSLSWCFCRLPFELSAGCKQC